jgi:hypothetical protein
MNDAPVVHLDFVIRPLIASWNAGTSGRGNASSSTRAKLAEWISFLPKKEANLTVGFLWWVSKCLSRLIDYF